MGVFREIFSWWGGNTWGTRLTIWNQGRFVGEDEFGNRYYEQRKGVGPLGRPRRFVTYKSSWEPTQVPPGWYGWLHYTTDQVPDNNVDIRRPWQKPHKMNETGTEHAYRPKGSILTPEVRPEATGDYKAWKP